ncbi:hypothetical protein IPM62_04055 [Candidatus Woesebacteria bacterium]|nr:MAG: hypothetical protein IPM62_04055 [Candidatus Woesebacteria bacterium]
MRKGFVHLLTPIVLVLIVVGALFYLNRNKSNPDKLTDIQNDTEMVVEKTDIDPQPETTTPTGQSVKLPKTVKPSPTAAQNSSNSNTNTKQNPTSTSTPAPTSTQIITSSPATPPTTAPKNQMGYVFSKNSIDTVVNNTGQVYGVLSFTSTGSTSFLFSGTPQYQGGINWRPASGANYAGQTIQLEIQVFSNVPEGVYEGTMTFTDKTTGITKDFSTKLTVL